MHLIQPSQRPHVDDQEAELLALWRELDETRRIELLAAMVDQKGALAKDA